MSLITTSKQEREFSSDLASKLETAAILQSALIWIRANMSPEQVFQVGDLDQWAEENGYVQIRSLHREFSESVLT